MRNANNTRTAISAFMVAALSLFAGSVYFFALTSSPWIVYLSRFTLGSYWMQNTTHTHTVRATFTHSAMGITRIHKQSGERSYHFPSARWENMLVLFIPVPFHNFTRMRLQTVLREHTQNISLIAQMLCRRLANVPTHFIFLHTRVMDETDIFVHIKVEQRTTFATSFRDNQVVERVILHARKTASVHGESNDQCVR